MAVAFSPAVSGHHGHSQYCTHKQDTAISSSQNVTAWIDTNERSGFSSTNLSGVSHWFHRCASVDNRSLESDIDSNTTIHACR